MPRIRKKTSNRKSTNERAKLRHKVSEGRKKNHKLAKKNTQWKSRLHKDPGIPNNLPFKDQILAEIAEERRLMEEEKQARKELTKLSSKRNRKKEGDNLDSMNGAVMAAPLNVANFQDASASDRSEGEDLTPLPPSSHPTRRVSFAARVKGGKGKNAEATSSSFSGQKRPGVLKGVPTTAAASKAKTPTLAKESATRAGATFASITSSKKQTKSSGEVGGEIYDFKQFF